MSAHIHPTARHWAYHAIGMPRKPGKEGFVNFRTGSWYHPLHYDYINDTYPTLSGEEAIDEMRDCRLKMVDHIMHLAGQIDDALARLAKMEQEMAIVMERVKEGAQ